MVNYSCCYCSCFCHVRQALCCPQLVSFLSFYSFFASHNPVALPIKSKTDLYRRSISDSSFVEQICCSTTRHQESPSCFRWFSCWTGQVKKKKWKRKKKKKPRNEHLPMLTGPHAHGYDAALKCCLPSIANQAEQSRNYTSLIEVTPLYKKKTFKKQLWNTSFQMKDEPISTPWLYKR